MQLHNFDGSTNLSIDVDSSFKVYEFCSNAAVFATNGCFQNYINNQSVIVFVSLGRYNTRGVEAFPIGEKLPAAKTTNSSGTRRQKLKTNTPLSRDTLSPEAVLRYLVFRQFDG